MISPSYGILDAYKELSDASSDSISSEERNVLVDNALEHLETAINIQRDKFVHEAALNESIPKTWRKCGGLVRKLCPEKFKERFQGAIGSIIKEASVEHKHVLEICKKHGVTFEVYQKFMEEFDGNIMRKSKRISSNFPTFKAVFLNDLNMIKVLKELGANVNQLEGTNSPLVLAVYNNSVEMVRLLFSLGAIENDESFLPLLAVKRNLVEMLTALKESGSDISRYNDPLMSPMAEAIFNNQPEMVIALEQLGVKKEYIENGVRKISLAHLWGVGGATNFTNDINISIDLEGLEIKYSMDMLLKYAEEFFNTVGKNEISKEVQEKIVGSLRSSLPLSSEKAQDGMSRIKSNEPLVILGGSEDHAVSIVISNGKLFVCNRGYKKSTNTSEIYSLPASKIDEALIMGLIKTYDDMVPFNEMVKGLELESLGGFSQKDQKVGNCTWASAKTAFFILLLEYVDKDTAKDVYKKFTAFTREKGFFDYLKDSFEIEANLFDKIKSKCSGKSELNIIKQLIETPELSAAKIKTGELDFEKLYANTEKLKKIKPREKFEELSGDDVEMQPLDAGEAAVQSRKRRKHTV